MALFTHDRLGCNIYKRLILLFTFMWCVWISKFIKKTYKTKKIASCGVTPLCPIKIPKQEQILKNSGIDFRANDEESYQ